MYEAATDSPCFVKMLEAQSSLPTLVKDTTRRILDSDGVDVEDTDHITTMRIRGKTRGLNERHVDHEIAGLKRVRAATRMRIVEVPRPSGFEPYTINDYYVEGPEAEEAVDPSVEVEVEDPAVADEPPVLVDATASEAMEQAWGDNKDCISVAMRAVVAARGGSADVAGMALIGAEDGFPDGTAFNMTTFVNTVCRRQEALAMAGLVFLDGVFEPSGL